MGLGKTVQIAALLAAIFKKKGTTVDRTELRLKRREGSGNGTCALVVAPASVMDNWERELKKWGYFEVRKLGSGGDEEVRQAVIENAGEGKVEIILVSHPMVAKLATSLKSKVKFSVMVVDECHMASNPKTHLHEALKNLTSNCRCRIGLTGTPMSNNYSELYNILNLLDPGFNMMCLLHDYIFSLL